MGSVADIGKEKTYPVTGEMYDRITKLIGEYVDQVSVPEVLGVLELVKSNYTK